MSHEFDVEAICAQGLDIQYPYMRYSLSRLWNLSAILQFRLRLH